MGKRERKPSAKAEEAAANSAAAEAKEEAAEEPPKAKPAKKAAKAEAKEEPLVVMKGKRLLDGDEEFVVYKRAKQRLENDDGDDELFDGAFYHKSGEDVTSANYKDVCEWSGIVEVAEWRKAAMAADAKAEGEAKAAAAAEKKKAKAEAAAAKKSKEQEDKAELKATAKQAAAKDPPAETEV